MTLPGPLELGRGVVVRAGDPIPTPWSGVSRVRLDAPTLDDAGRTGPLLERLHRAWMGREPVVVVWEVDDDALSHRETSADPPWRLDPSFLFPRERLRFLVFSNNYDARTGTPRWWWAHKAALRIGVEEGGPADVIRADGTPAWIDGGPRQPLPPLDAAVIHGETVEVGSDSTVVAPIAPHDPDLAPDQLQAVAHLSGAARVIAPAGSGKTRTLAARLRHLVADRGVEPLAVTAVAYNARAADELRQRLGANRATVRTIHSLGWAILHDARPGLTLLEEPGARNLLTRLVDVPRRVNTDPVGPFLEALEQARSGLCDPEVVELERDDVPGFAAMFEEFRTEMYRRDRVDHGEQVYGAIESLLRDPDLRSRWQGRCRHLLVDEFQDLTPAYLLLLRLVAAPQLQVFGVGDDDQVIYGYAGADPGFLIDFEHYFPGAGSHALEVNYRCPPAVVEAATHILSYNRRRIDKTIRAGKDRALDRSLDVRLRPGPELAAAAADLIEELIASGVEPTDIAVLTRVNSALIPVKAALVERDLPTADLLSADVLQRTALRALFAWVRLALRPERMERRDLLEAVRRPGRGLSGVAREALTSSRVDLEELTGIGRRLAPKQAERWARFTDDVTAAANVAAGDDAAATLRLLIEDTGLASTARTLDSGRSNASRSSHLDDLVAVQRSAAVHPALGDFARWLAGVLGHHAQPDGVTLSSIHRVKGMEWKRVLVFGADRGAMPHDLATDIEEERRVFHVALTRAIEQSVVLADVARPTRFIAELDGTASRLPPADESTRSVRSRRSTPRHVFVGDEVTLSGGYAGTVTAINGTAVSVRMATGADLIVPAGDVRTVATVTAPAAGAPDPALVEVLRQWRRETSQRLGVPAYVVLHDSTIEAIAAARPATERALIGVPGIGAAKLEQYGDEILALVVAGG